MTTGEFYNNLTLTLDHAWSLIEGGVKNRKSAFHTPALCTLSAGGSPQSRVLVLREANRTQNTLRFHSDMRSPKIKEIISNPRASVLFYDPETKVQLRLSGRVQINHKGADVDAIWAAADRFARRCYMTQAAPSSISDVPTSGLPQSAEGREPDETELVPARANFTLLVFEVQHIDWLYLASQGHRRAMFNYNAEAQSWDGNWAVP